MNILAWHQAFSNYKIMDFQPNKKIEILQLTQNFSGKRIRVEISNIYDTEPLYINYIKVSLSKDTEKTTYITFDRNVGCKVEPNTSIWTDFVEFNIPKGHDIFFEISVQNQSNILSSSANLLSKKIIKSNIEKKITFIYGIASVELDSQENDITTLGFFGDSLTNQGYFSDTILKNLYSRKKNITGFNAGISGNRLINKGKSQSKWRDSFGKSGVERFYDDVISYNPDFVIGLIGINDLFQSQKNISPYLPTVEEMISAFKKILEQSKKFNIIYVPLTIPPFANSLNNGELAWSPEKEQIRQKVNNWLKKQSNTIDISSFLQDNENPSALRKKFDCGDHLHFSEVGGEELGLYIVEKLVHILN